MLKNTTRNLLPVILVAFLMATIWVFFTRAMYDYNMGFREVWGLNIFPLLAWTGGLTLGYILIERTSKKLKLSRQSPYRLVTAVLLYAVAVLIIETVGYHVFGVQNIGTSQYAGIPLCDCLHAPPWMQFGYFLLGPLHWLVLRTLAFLPKSSHKQATPTQAS